MSFDKLYQEFLDQDDPDFPTTQEVKMKWFYQQARREGWEQCQREARGKLSARYERYLNSETIYILNEIECCERAIAAMEYGGEK